MSTRKHWRGPPRRPRAPGPDASTPIPHETIRKVNDGGSIIMTGSVASVKGFPGFGEKGGIALIRTHVAQRTEVQEYPGERAEPGADRHTGFPATRQGDEGDVRIPDPPGKDGSS